MVNLRFFGCVSGMALLAASVVSCSNDDPEGNIVPLPPVDGQGLFVVCEGGFGSGNASLALYDVSSRQIHSNVFQDANGALLGDVAQSMTIHNGKGWIVVNRSNVIFAIDPNTAKEVGRVTDGISSPRYLHFVSGQKAYVSQLAKNEIAVLDPESYTVTSSIPVPGYAENMAQIGDNLYVTCWSYGNKVVRINTESDNVDKEVEVGVQPKYIVADGNDRLWVITDGGWEGNPAGYEEPTLVCLDENLNILSKTGLPRASEYTSAGGLCINAAGDTLYWYNGSDIWSMSVDDIDSRKVLIENACQATYGLTVDPVNSQIYVADAVDYSQQGMVYRFSADGKVLMDEFRVGICPSSFCWK